MLTSSVILGLALALVRGGDLRRLAALRFRGWWLFVAAFLLKFAIVRLSALGVSWMVAYGSALHIAVFVLLLVPLVLSRSLPGMQWVLAGTGLNFLVIAANGGRMPVLEQALIALGKDKTLESLRAGLDVTHSLITSDTAFPWLGDWIPAPLPVAAVASPGDILLALGVVLLVNTVTGPSYGKMQEQRRPAS